MRKPRFAKGDQIVVEDNEETFEIVSEPKPFKMSALSKRDDSWEYQVKEVPVKGRKPKSKKPYWVAETDILGKVTFQPLNFRPSRHFALADELPGYETMREFLETLDDKKLFKGMNVVRNLKDLLENVALYEAGTREEHADASEEVGFALR